VRALVTGAAGFLGARLVSELRRRGDEVVAVVRPTRRVPPALDGVSLLRTDLRQPDDAIAQALADVDVVYHLAAKGTGSWREMFESNVLATEKLVQTIAGAGWRGRFVHVSTFAAYDLNGLKRRARVDERTPLEPHPERRDDYAWTKLLQEREIRTLLEHSGGPELVIVRPGAVYGPERQFQGRVGRRVGRVVLLFGGRNIIPLSYVENTASLIAECGHHPAAAGEIFNAVDPEVVTQLRYLREWMRAQERRPLVIPVPLTVLRLAGAAYAQAQSRAAGRVNPPVLLRPYAIRPSTRPLRYAPSRAQTVLGWRAPVAVHEAFARTFAAQEAGPSSRS
jgi:nucleoside-diphosphate-sugar epimerase